MEEIWGERDMPDVDVVLVNPHPSQNIPFSTREKLPPLGLAFLAAILRKNGYEVRIVDNYLDRAPPDKVVKDISKLSPFLVGLTCTSITYQPCIKLARKIKRQIEVPIVLGGPHPTVLPDSVLRHQFIDYVVIGEGEYTLLELVTKIKKGKDVRDVRGLMYRKSSEGYIFTGRRPFIEDLDSLPHPARDLLPMRLYPNQTRFCSRYPVLSINSSRGCVFGCRFCSVRSIWGRRFRYFSPSWVLEDIEQLVHTYGAQGIYFREDNFTVNPKRVIGICDGILERGLDIGWVCESRVDLLSENLLNKMRKAGCETIYFGVESGSQRILDYLNKGITIQKVERARYLSRKVGVKFGASLMIGTPGESRKEMKKTLEFAKKLKPDYCWFNIFVGLPNSPLYKEVISSGQFSHIDDNCLVYVKTEEFDYELMKKIAKEFTKAYARPHILKPTYAVRRILRVRSLAELSKLVRTFLGLLH